MAHFLCVDDELSAFVSVEYILKELGHTADYADGPSTALSMLGFVAGVEPYATYDGIICDNFMGENGAGVALLTKLRELGLTQPMILHTSTMEYEVRDILRELNAHHSQKSLINDDLETILQRLFELA